MILSNIEWTDCVWNPITGCKHGCEYCYARPTALMKIHHPDPKVSHKYRNGFEPTFHPEEFAADKVPASVKGGKRVFVGSMADNFGEWVPDSWIEKVFKACEDAPQHTYYFLTKNPKRYNADGEFENKSNWWAGISATCEFDFIQRYKQVNVRSDRVFVSLEPLLDGEDLSLTRPLDYTGPDLDAPGWLIVGSETRNGRPVNMPKREWIMDIRSQCADMNISLFEKNSLQSLHLPGGLIQQWPKEALYERRPAT